MSPAGHVDKAACVTIGSLIGLDRLVLKAFYLMEVQLNGCHEVRVRQGDTCSATLPEIPESLGPHTNLFKKNLI